MQANEKIVIFVLFIVLGAAGFIVGFWAGGGFDNSGIADYQKREQALNDRLAEFEKIESGLRAELESERSQRESLESIAKSTSEENRKLRTIIDESGKSTGKIENRLSENDRRLESVIEKVQRLGNNINDSNSGNSD